MRNVQKVRLDVLLVQRGMAESCEQAKRLVMAGQVSTKGHVLAKPGHQIPTDSDIRVRRALPFVSRGGSKLEGALGAFDLDVRDLVVVDIGASTGGFTDCLLQRGAAKVYAIDVGYGQLAWSLRQHPRVVVMERTNIRYVERLPELADLATVDASFISLTLVLPAVRRLLGPEGQIVALIKPQFEAGRELVGKGGVVRDSQVHRQVLLRLLNWGVDQGWSIRGLAPSPLRGPAGNIEFFVWLSPLVDRVQGSDVESLVDGCMDVVSTMV